MTDLSLQDLVEKHFLGKIVTKFEYGGIANPEEAEECGERFVILPAKVEKIYLGMSESREDAVIWFTLKGNEEPIAVYSNENVYLKGDE